LGRSARPARWCDSAVLCIAGRGRVGRSYRTGSRRTGDKQPVGSVASRPFPSQGTAPATTGRIGNPRRELLGETRQHAPTIGHPCARESAETKKPRK
jgi:hypothetical protein